MVEEDGNETVVREQIESFEPFTVFGNTPPDVYDGYTDFQAGRSYLLRAETYLSRRAEGAVTASKELTFKVILEEKLKASDGAANDEFGASVAIDGGTVVIGSYKDDAGSAYVYRVLNGSAEINPFPGEIIN